MSGGVPKLSPYKGFLHSLYFTALRGSQQTRDALISHPRDMQLDSQIIPKVLSLKPVQTTIKGIVHPKNKI